MSLGIVDDKEFEAELERSRVITIPKGRGNNPNTPESLRKIIGENAIEEGSNATKAMTRALGISDSSLSAYKQGAHSTANYNQPNPELLQHVNRTREKIVKKARSRLHAALNSLTPEKLKDEKPRDLAAIAKDMSAIVKDFEPRSDDEGKGKNALIIYAPTLINEARFESIEVRE